MAGNANSGKGRRPSTKVGRPSSVTPEVREAVYRLYVDSQYSVDECVEWVRSQNQRWGKSAIQSFLTSERKRRELAALEGDLGVHLMEMYRQLSHDVAVHHAAADEIWRKMPDYEKNTMKGWKARQDCKHSAMNLQLKMLEIINAASNPDKEMVQAKDELAEKLGVVLEEDKDIDVG